MTPSADGQPPVVGFVSYCQLETLGDGGDGERAQGAREGLSSAPGQTSVLHFFSKLRRHASLEGAGPYFRRWKFDSSHRAASLDAKGRDLCETLDPAADRVFTGVVGCVPGSPKRRPFHRQRAASETTDHTEDDSSSLRDGAIESFPPTPVQTTGLQSLSAESLCHSSSATSSSVLLHR